MEDWITIRNLMECTPTTIIVAINAIIIGTVIYYTTKLFKIVWVSIDVNK